MQGALSSTPSDLLLQRRATLSAITPRGCARIARHADTVAVGGAMRGYRSTAKLRGLRDGAEERDDHRHGAREDGPVR